MMADSFINTSITEDTLPDDIMYCYVDTGLEADNTGRFDAYCSEWIDSFEAVGSTPNQVAYGGFIDLINKLQSDIDVIIYTTNRLLVKQVYGEFGVNEPALIPLWENLLEVLVEKPRIKIAFMCKSDLKCHIRSIKTEIAKREAKIEVNPDDYDYDDDEDDCGVCPW